MKKLLVLVALVGCTEVSDYSDGIKVQIEGREFFVKKTPHAGPNVYYAVPNKQSGAALVKRDFSLAAQNVAAIEAVSGCKVQLATVENLSIGSTYAAVKC